MKLGDTLVISFRGRSLNEHSVRFNGVKVFCIGLASDGLALSGSSLTLGGANSKIKKTISESFVLRDSRMVLTEKDISSFKL